MPIARKNLFMTLLFVFTLTATTAVSAQDRRGDDNSPAAAGATARTSSDDGNIFTPPEGAGEPIPSFTEGNPPSERVKRAFLGDKKDGIPNFEQVRTLPSLTAQQRRELRQILTQAKQQVQPILQQLNELKEKNGGDVKKAMADPDSRERFIDLRRQVRDLRKQTWEQIRSLMSDGQLQELEAMRHGELQPATFNPPVTDPREAMRQFRGERMPPAQRQTADDRQSMPADSDSMPARQPDDTNN